MASLFGTLNGAATGVPHSTAQRGLCPPRPLPQRQWLSATPASPAAAAAAVAAAPPPAMRACRRRARLPQPPAAAAAAAALPQLMPAAGPWGVWTGLVLAGAFGMWSERTRLGKELSGALVATLAGMALANLGYMPPHAREVDVVFKFLLPLAIPMLLLSANLTRIVRDTGRLLIAYLLGAACTAAGTLAAMAAFSLTPSLGAEGWRIAAALTARHIGGAVNYMAVSDALGVSPTTFGAGLAADDLILTVYFTTIYSLARHIPPDRDPQSSQQQPTSDSAGGDGSTPNSSNGSGDSGTVSPDSAPSHSGGGHGHGARLISVPHGMAALALSIVVCYVGTQTAAALQAPTQGITLITALTVALATALPRQLAPLVASGEGLAMILMMVFYAAVGASANVGLVVRSAPVLFLFSFITLAVHLGLLLTLGRAAGFTRRDLLLASNANIGGPSTVAGMAAAKGWRTVMVPAILTSTLGYALGSLVGLSLGWSVLRYM